MDKVKELLKNKEAIRHYFLYILFGVLTTAVDFLTFLIFKICLPNLNENISNAISIFVAIIFAYFTNSKYVFNSNTNDKIKEFCKFFLSRMSSTVINVFLFWLLTTITDINEFIIKAFISAIVLALNYIFSKFFVFIKN